MKVKYAVHVLSSSVVNAIEFLEAEGFQDFQNSSATVKFLKKFLKIITYLIIF